MADTVEIYVCMEGQALKDGKVEYSNSISDKYAAEQDAKARVKRNPKIHKIAYYRVNDEGDFRIFYSFTNPDLVSNKTTIEQHNYRGVSAKRKRRPKRTWWQKLLGLSPKPRKAPAKAKTKPKPVK